MRSDSARAHTAAVVAGGAALVIYWLTAPDAPAWPTTDTLGAAGRSLIDAVSRVPLGDQAVRAITLAVLMGSVSAAMIAWIIVRRGYAAAIAVGCALTMAFTPSTWHQATSDAPGSVAAVLVAGAIGVTMLQVSYRARIATATVALIAAFILQPPLRGPDTNWTTALQSLRREWLLPSGVAMCVAIMAPVWRARPAPPVVILGTGLVVVLGAIGYDVAPLAALPALLLAHGVQSLSPLSSRAKATMAMGLALLAAFDQWQAPQLQEWRVLAWRDAVERALPGGATILTGSRAAAALNGPLFQERPSRIRVVFDPDGRSNDAGEYFLLDDLRGAVVAAGAVVAPISLVYANTTDALERLPRGTIVGLAISAASAAAEPARVVEALALIGRLPEAGRGTPLAVAGVIGAPPQDPPYAVDAAGRLHVLIGDLIHGRNRRSPADFELRASVAEVSVRLEGRVLVEGSGWAMIAIDPGGPLIDAAASEHGTTWPVRVPGLALWTAGGAEK